MRVERVRPEDWEALRELRLEALQDTPIGFLELYADALAQPVSDWQQRAVRSSEGDVSAMFLAREGDRTVGMMGGFVRGPEQGGTPGRVTVVAVYVQPGARASRVLDDLLAAVEGWARAGGARELDLEVHEDNARAQRAYTKRGFIDTGLRVPYPPDPSRDELTMVRRLPDPAR